MALRKYKKEILALKGRYINGLPFIIVILCYAISGLKTLKCSDPGRCPGLVCYALSGLKTLKYFYPGRSLSVPWAGMLRPFRDYSF